jgi:hypothetical protein
MMPNASAELTTAGGGAVCPRSGETGVTPVFTQEKRHSIWVLPGENGVSAGEEMPQAGGSSMDGMPVKGTGSKAKGKKDNPPQFAGRVQRRMERMFGAIPPSPKSTPTPRLNPFRSFGDLGDIICGK